MAVKGIFTPVWLKAEIWYFIQEIAENVKLCKNWKLMQKYLFSFLNAYLRFRNIFEKDPIFVGFIIPLRV